MRVVARVSCILVVLNVNGNSSGFLFRSVVNLVNSTKADLLPGHVQDMEDSRGQGCLAMVDVTDGAHIDVRLVSLKFFCHIF